MSGRSNRTIAVSLEDAGCEVSEPATLRCPNDVEYQVVSVDGDWVVLRLGSGEREVARTPRGCRL